MLVNEEEEEDGPELSLNPLGSGCGGEDAGEEVHEGSIWYVVMSSCIGFMLFGYDTGVVSGAADWAGEEFKLSDGELGVCVGGTAVAAAAACLTATWMNTHFGRKRTIMISSLLYALGALVVAASTGFLVLAAGRTILGWAIGLATTTVPLYVAECVPPSQRGRMITLNDLCVATGQVLAGVCNIVVNPQWRLSMGIAAVPAIAQFVMFLFLPESPRILSRQGKLPEADVVFKRFNGNHDPALAELRAMHDQVRQSAGSTPFLDAWRNPAHRRVFLLGIFMMMMNQASGINTVMYYSAKLLETAGFSETEAIWGALVCDITQACGVCVSLYYMEKLGRRKLAILSAVMVFPTITMLGVSFLAKLHLVSLVCIGAYLFSFGLGLSGVPWTVNSEIFALSIRSVGQSQAIFTNWFLNGIIAIVFRMFIDDALAFFFFFFGFVALTGAIWMHKHLPETKGLTLEQIESLFHAPLTSAVRNGVPTLNLDEEFTVES